MSPTITKEMPGRPSLYDRLGVSRSADAAEIKKAYRRLVLEHHPDKGGDPEAFKDIQKAYEILSDDGRRSMYDTTGQEGDEEGGGGPGGPGGMPFPFPFDLGAMFGGMGGMPFGMGGGPGGPQRPGGRRVAPKGPPKIHEMPISLWDFYYGKKVTIQFERQRFCGSCKGEGVETWESCRGCGGSGMMEQHVMMGPGMMGVMRGACRQCEGVGRRPQRMCGACGGTKFRSEEKTLEVTIEPGMLPGEVIKFARECSDQHEYLEAGDVHIVLQAADEEIRFRRHPTQRDDLIVTTGIRLQDSLLGCTERMESHPGYPQGLVVEIPVGIQNKEKLELAGLGMPRRGGGRGALHVVVEVRASEEERAALRRGAEMLRSLFTSEQTPQDPPPGAIPDSSPSLPSPPAQA